MYLNFAGTESGILLHLVSSCRRVIPLQKITLNLNREVTLWAQINFSTKNQLLNLKSTENQPTVNHISTLIFQLQTWLILG